jgi:hypothetical protein
MHQLLEMYSSILISLENKEANCFIFCDFSKAFDKVWHRGLLHKKKAYGINGNFIDWFNSYLKDREQKVIKKYSSAYCEISAGITQGSILGLSYALSIYIKREIKMFSNVTIRENHNNMSISFKS